MSTAYPSENIVIASELYEGVGGDFIVGCLVIILQGQAFSSYVLQYNESSIFIKKGSELQKYNYDYLSNKNNLNDLSYGMFNVCNDQIEPQYRKTTTVYIPTDNSSFILPGLFNDVNVNLQKIFGNGVKPTPTFTEPK